MRTSILLAALVACGGESVDPPPPTGPQTHQVVVGADGSFTPATLEIRVGDTVEWLLSAPTDAIVQASDPALAADVCASALPYAAGDLTGPSPVAASGIFALGPAEPGFVLESTWASPSLDGVFIRIEWNHLQLAPGSDDASFDFTQLDTEVEQAVRHGKLYNLAIKAGASGTPDWLFTSGVTPLELQDGGGDVVGCGSRMRLGSPTDPMYQQHYFAMLRKVAAHLKARGDWYRALAYIKPSGANLFSHENRLPKRCEPGCVCNPEVFAAHGYTPSGLLAFYAAQTELLAAEFPDKTMSYALIQAGFPRVNDAGDFEQEDGSSSGGPLPGGNAQTQAIIDQGQATHGLRFAVSHNGLQTRPPSGTCPNEGKHPAVGPYADIGRCPNHWVLQEGAEGQVTGYQTNNADGVASSADVESALQNLWDNSDGIYLEIYEQRLQEADHAPGGILDPAASGRTLAQWGEELHRRRREMFPTLPDPRPLVHRHTFSEEGVSHYLHSARCTTGRITVTP